MLDIDERVIPFSQAWLKICLGQSPLSSITKEPILVQTPAGA